MNIKDKYCSRVQRKNKLFQITVVLYLFFLQSLTFFFGKGFLLSSDFQIKHSSPTLGNLPLE